jgi:hypothetical protein
MIVCGQDTKDFFMKRIQEKGLKIKNAKKNIQVKARLKIISENSFLKKLEILLPKKIIVFQKS